MTARQPCVLEPAHRPGLFLFKHNGFDISRCPDCGLVMSGSEIEEEAREDETYYTLAHSQAKDVYFEWGFRWRWILSRIARFRAAGDALDVGAGNGLFVKVATEEFGWKARGLELSNHSIRFAKQVLDVDLEPVMLAETSGEFDLVTCFNLIEHLLDPVAMIGQMGAKLRPGGLVALSTPSPSCIHARLKGLKRWGMVAPPHHINLFSRRALEVALAKSGFELLRHDTISTYIRALRRFETRGDLLRQGVFQALRLTGLGADHLVIARKL